MTRAELIARMRHIDLIDFRDEDEDEHVAQLVDAIQSIVDSAVKAEREACSKVCDQMAASLIKAWASPDELEIAVCLRDAIRARGQP